MIFGLITLGQSWVLQSVNLRNSCDIDIRPDQFSKEYKVQKISNNNALCDKNIYEWIALVKRFLLSTFRIFFVLQTT